jgi:hypothetical protein
VPGQRNHVLLLLATLTITPCWAAAPDIILPDPLAVELPLAAIGLSVDDEQTKDLIAAVRADGRRVTVAFPRDRIGAGIWRVIWSAWDGDDRSHPAARRESFLYVLPHGMTPVANTSAPNATAGNNTTHIARDAAGSVHMVWSEGLRGGTAPGAKYRRARVLPDGSARFETDVAGLAPHAGDWTARPALTAVGDTIHFTWQANGHAWYRSLTRDPAGWRWSNDVDTMAPSPGHDTGPSIAAGAESIHILTLAGICVSSTDGGLTWTPETVPFGTVQRVKTASLSLDSEGHPLAGASVVIKDPAHLSEQRGSGGYWTLRLARRIAMGAWEAIPGPVDGRPEWAEPVEQDEDVLTDWIRVLEDRTGGMHVTWHGTAVSRIYANDRAYYAWRPPGEAWRTPVTISEPQPALGLGWSYAPALTLDGDRALTLMFQDLHAGLSDRGFDAELDLFRDGRLIARALPVTRFARDSIAGGEPARALSTWFPGAASSLVRGADGRIWADILMTLSPTGVEASALVVWQRLDLTDWLTTADR